MLHVREPFVVAAWPFAIKAPVILSSFAASFRKQSLFTDLSPWAYICHHPGCGLFEPAQNRRHQEAGGRALMAASGSNRAEAGDLCVAGHQQGNLVRPRREAGCHCGDRDGVFFLLAPGGRMCRAVSVWFRTVKIWHFKTFKCLGGTSTPTVAAQSSGLGFLFKSHRAQLSPQGQAQMAEAGQGPGLSACHGAEILPESLFCFDSDKSWKPWASLLFLKARQHNPALGLIERNRNCSKHKK